MNDSELIDFYRADSAIQIMIAEQSFSIAAKWEVRPEEWELPWIARLSD